MSITFACGHCGKVFTLDDQFAGKKGKCKQCGAIMLIPGDSPTMASPAQEDFEISPSRRTPGQSPTPTSRTAPAARPTPRPDPEPDIYGFDDEPTPPRSKVMELGEEDFAPENSPRLPRAPRPRFDPPRNKKGSDGAGPIVGKVIGIGLVVLVLFGGFGAVMRSMIPGFQSRSGLEAMLKERVALNEQLAALLGNVNDVASAQSASQEANAKLKAITNNLKKLKVTNGLQTDLDALKKQYAFAQEQASQQVVNQILRIARIPDAVNALNIQASIEELDREEKSIPGLQQDQILGNGPSAPPGMPPGFNRNAPSLNPPGFGNGNGPGVGRGDIPTPGFGRRARPPGS